MQSNPPAASMAAPTPTQRLSSGMRAVYAGLGVVALATAALIVASAFIGGWLIFLWAFVIVALLTMGISDIAASTSSVEAPQGLRTLRLVLGIIIILFAFIAVFSVFFALTLLWIFVGLGLLFQGMFLLMGVGASNQLEGWQRGMGTALGVIDVIFAFLVLLLPVFAFILVWILLTVAVLAAAIYLLGIASSGVKRPLPVMMNVPGFMPPVGGMGGGAPPPASPPT